MILTLFLKKTSNNLLLAKINIQNYFCQCRNKLQNRKCPALLTTTMLTFHICQDVCVCVCVRVCICVVCGHEIHLCLLFFQSPWKTCETSYGCLQPTPLTFIYVWGCLCVCMCVCVCVREREREAGRLLQRSVSFHFEESYSTLPFSNFSVGKLIAHHIFKIKPGFDIACS